MSVRDLLADAAARLGADAGLDVELLLAHVLERPRVWLYAWPEHEPSSAERAAFERMVAARARGEPVAYLIGRREFWTLDLAVTPDVLIPRHETELLVELALARMPPERAVRLADLGTGSGAIALAIARERPRAIVIATDASTAALDVARRNAERLGIANVSFVHSDWFAALGGERFDLIVSNPPYVASRDPHLDAGDLRYEPAGALVAGPDGLDAIRRIVADAPSHLCAGGWLLLEHGWDQAARVRALLENRGYVDIATARDASGHDRATFARMR